MNREEAKAIILKEYLCVDRDCDIDRSCGKCDLMMPSKEPILEAYKIAIKALEQEPCDTCGYEEGSIYCKEHCPHEAKIEQEPVFFPPCQDCNTKMDEIRRAYDKLQKPCGNTIDRAEAMTEIMMFAGNMKSDEEDIYIKVSDAVQLLRELPSVNPQPCEDAISRQAVQDYVAKYLSQYLYNDVREAVEVIDEYIGELPSVTPQPKTGEWNTFELFQSGIKETWYECPKCKWSNALLIPRNYCPNCGCRMVEPQERSDKE